MTIDPVASALDAVVAHLAATLTGAIVRRGWPEANVDLDLGTKPVVSVAAGPGRVRRCSPAPVDEDADDGTLTVTYRVGYLDILLQVDLWAACRSVRDDTAALLEAALDNQLPKTSGLWLTSSDYYSRPLSLEATESRIDDSGNSAPRGEWRQTWTLECATDLVAQAEHPEAAEVVFEMTTDLSNLEITETTTITP